MLRHSPNHGTLLLSNDDDGDDYTGALTTWGDRCDPRWSEFKFLMLKHITAKRVV